MVIEVHPTDPPGDASVIAVRTLDDELLVKALETALETGRESRRIGPYRSETYLEHFEQFSSEFEISEVGDGDRLYFNVDGTTVDLVVSASPPNRDHFRSAHG